MKLFSLLSSFILLKLSCIASIDDSSSEFPLTATSSDEIEELHNSLLVVSIGFGVERVHFPFLSQFCRARLSQLVR